MSHYPGHSAYPNPTQGGVSGYPGYQSTGTAYPGGTAQYKYQDTSAMPASPLLQNSVFTPTVNAAALQQPPTNNIDTKVVGPVTTAKSSADEDFSDAVQKEDIPKREIFNVTSYDTNSNPNISCMLEAKQAQQSQIEFVTNLGLLFNYTTTIMVILTAFKRNASPEAQEKFGSDWEALTNFMIYFPLCFFLLTILAVNNYFSERVFYDYLKRGILVDYPNTSEYGYLFKSLVPLAFIIPFLVYLLLCVGVMIRGQSPVGFIITFLLNMVVGIAMWWLRQQSIESRFVSLSDFIMCFPSREQAFHSIEEREKNRIDAKMDELNLKHAAVFLKRLVLNFSEKPSYLSDMRLFRWKDLNYTTFERFIFHIAVWVLIGSCIGACVAYFFYQGEADIENVWNNMINPCVQSCANVTSTFTSKANFNIATCDSCLCSCMQGYHKIHDAYTSKCAQHFDMPSVCNAVGTQAAMCDALTRCGSFTLL